MEGGSDPVPPWSKVLTVQGGAYRWQALCKACLDEANRFVHGQAQ